MEIRKYPTYHYIKFVWAKKLFLIIFSVLCLVAGAAYSYMKPPTYSTKALVFTGNGENKLLSKPDFITIKYGEELPDSIKGSLKVKIEDNHVISFSLSGGNKKTVEENLNTIAKKYTSDLSKRFDDQYQVQKNYVNSLKEKIEKTEENIAKYNTLVASTTDAEKLNYLTKVLINLEEVLQKDQVTLSEEEYDYVIAEKPELTSISTTSSGNNLKRNMALGGVFGFQLMLVILVFWKYLIDARRSDS